MMDGLDKGERPDAGHDGDDRAARPRDSLFLGATMRLSGEREGQAVRVRNLSEQGAMVEVDRDLPVGTKLELDLRNIGAVPGHVVWAMAGRVGVALDRPIDPIRARSRVGGGGQAAPRR